MTKFYITRDNHLIRYNVENNTYRFTDIIKNVNPINIEEIPNLGLQEIKREEFSRLMNIFFSKVKHEWVHDGVLYRKLDNFEKNHHSLSANYILGKDVPIHIPKNSLQGKYILVYHWGKVYYHTISYNGYKQGMLIDIKTDRFLQWAQLCHCAPIFNTHTKKIC